MAESAAVDAIPVSTESVQIAGEAHGQVFVVNDSDTILYLRYGYEAATADDWSVQLDPGDVLIEDNYRGSIQAVWGAADDDGYARVTIAS